ncbi:hypothetical protein [Streptomyces sp. NPDC002346]
MTLPKRALVGVDVVRDLGLPDRRDAAAAALVVLGSDAVPPLLRELRDEASPVDRREITAVLGRIGGAGFDDVLQGLLDAPTEESRHRVGFAFSRYTFARNRHSRPDLVRRRPRRARRRVPHLRGSPDSRPDPPALPESGDHARRHGVSYIAGPDGSIGAGKGERACQAHGVTLTRSGPGLFHH